MENGRPSQGCSDPLPPEVVEGFDLFDRRCYFDAHEALEAAWKAEKGPIRDFYRGILQVAVAYYHIQRGNYRGARKMFLRCRPWLAPFPERCMGIDLAQFHRDFNAVEAAIIRLGPEHISSLDPVLLKPLPRIGDGRVFPTTS